MYGDVKGGGMFIRMLCVKSRVVKVVFCGVSLSVRESRDEVLEWSMGRWCDDVCDVVFVVS